jgi:molecular chaperone GrpE
VAEDATDEPATLERIAREVAELRDLFQRRLVSDRLQKQQHEVLYGQLEAANAQLANQSGATLLRELILLVDRVERSGGPAPSEDLVASIRDELLELLLRQGVERIAVIGMRFDPQWHLAASVVPVDSADRDGVVTAELRAGYVIGDRVLRPADVVVGRYEAMAEIAEVG